MFSQSRMQTVLLTLVVLAALNRVDATRELISGDGGGIFG